MRNFAEALVASFLIFSATGALAQNAQPAPAPPVTQTPPAPPPPLTNDEANAIVAAVKNELIDPESAMFKDVVIYRHGTHAAACGLVNAKNRMGGYAGFVPFTAMVGVDSFHAAAMVYQEGEDKTWSEIVWKKLWDQFCQNTP